MKAALAFFLASLLLFGCTQEYGGAAHPGQRQATGQEASPSVSYANLTYGNLAMENSVLAGIKNITPTEFWSNITSTCTWHFYPYNCLTANICTSIGNSQTVYCCIIYL